MLTLSQSPRVTLRLPRRPSSMRFVFAAMLIVAFFVAKHDIWYSTHPFEADSAASFAEAMDAGSSWRQVAFLAVGVVASLILLRYRGRATRVPRGVLGWALITFLVWCAASACWADPVWLAARRLGLFAILSITALAYTREFSANETMSFAAVASATYCAVGVVAEVLLGTFHPFQTDYRFSGTLHPNLQGANCAVLVLSSFALLRRGGCSRVLSLAAIILGGYLLLLTGSRTAVASVLLVLVACALIRASRPYLAVVLLLVLSLAILGLLIGGSSFSAPEHVLLLSRGEGTLTFRFDLWRELLTYFKQRPLLGYGYGAFWNPDRILDLSGQSWSVSSSHSDYVAVVLNLGAVGLGLYLLVLGSAVIRGATLAKNQMGKFSEFDFGILLFYVLDGLLETHLFNPGLLAFLSMTAIVRLATTPRTRLLQQHVTWLA